MPPSSDLPPRLRAQRPSGAGMNPGGAGPPVCTVRAQPVPPLHRPRALPVLMAGLILSALGHAAFALWIARLPAVAPPDGPDMPATEVLILSGAQFSALTAPAPQPPDPAPQALLPPLQDAAPTALPRALSAVAGAQGPVGQVPPAAGQPPDLAALTAEPADPEAAFLMPELVAPVLSDAGVRLALSVPAPVSAPPPVAPEAPARADPVPDAPETAPAPPMPPKTTPKPPAPTQGAARPASVAGDGGKAETTRRAATGDADARAAWLSAIRARVERRKVYPETAGGAEGRVTLQLTVDRAGRLASVAVLRSSGHATLDAAALRAVRAAGRFPKAPKDVSEASVTFNLPLRYSAGS